MVLSGHRRGFLQAALCVGVLIGSGARLVRGAERAGVVLADTSETGIFVDQVGDYSLELDLFVPSVDTPPPLAIFIHGGGWSGGNRGNLYVDWLLEYGYAVASLSYRLSSEALFPAQVEDCKRSIRWLRAHALERGYDGERFAALGTSAGGYLALMMGVTGNTASIQIWSEPEARVQAVVSYWGPTDFPHRSVTQPEKTESPQGSVYRLLGGPVSESLERAKQASPIYHVDGGDPPVLLIHGARDSTVYLDQSQRLYRAYVAAGLEASLMVSPHAGHGGSAYQEPRFREAVLEFLRDALQ